MRFIQVVRRPNVSVRVVSDMILLCWVGLVSVRLMNVFGVCQLTDGIACGIQSLSSVVWRGGRVVM